MATKYIEADKVEKITWEEPSYYDPLNVLTEVRDKVRELPAADVVSMDRYINAIKTINMMSKVLEDFEPVKHGHWVAMNADGRGYADEFGCTNCSCVVKYGHFTKGCDYERCPYCGAKMDEEKE